MSEQRPDLQGLSHPADLGRRRRQQREAQGHVAARHQRRDRTAAQGQDREAARGQGRRGR